MSLFEGVGGFLFFLAFLYFGMSLMAFSHARKDLKPQDAHPISMLWPFHEEIYDEFGKRLCRIGRILFVFVWGLGGLWFLVKYTVYE